MMVMHNALLLYMHKFLEGLLINNGRMKEGKEEMREERMGRKEGGR